MRTSTRAVAAALVVAAFAIPTTVHADSEPTLSEPIAEGLAGPLQLTVQGDTVYVGQSFAGLLTKITPHGTEDIAVNPDGEIAGSAVDGQDGGLHDPQRPARRPARLVDPQSRAPRHHIGGGRPARVRDREQP